MGLSLKLTVVSTAGAMSTAVMFKLLSISDLHTIWTGFISWLEPPYLYVIINCIIITIVASSRLQSKFDGYSHSLSAFLMPVLVPTELVKVSVHDELPLVHEPEVLIDEPVMEGYEEIDKNRVVNKSVISVSTWTPSKINQVGLAFPVDRPPASARFSHRKTAKATAEGGKTLGVTKPKRQDTLETTWKTITEGRSVPLTRHLRKSDTWETNGHNHHNSEELTKSNTFDDVNRGRKGGASKPPPPTSKLSRSGGSGRLRKEPSLGQEELNRKVEAFIKKFNEDMRLQRQESMNQYMEMINRGAH